MIVIPTPLRLTDITSIRVKEENAMATMTGAERNARDDRFMAHIWDDGFIAQDWGKAGHY